MGNGVIEMDVGLCGESGKLGGCGLVWVVDCSLSEVEYYGDGGWEKYVEGKDGCGVGG